MSEYCIIIEDSTGWLVSSYTVTPEAPIREWPAGYTRIIITDTQKYNEIVDFYNQHTTNAVYSYDEQTGVISFEVI